MKQRSDEWVRARLGKVTASRISDVVARTKSGWGASRFNYMAELVAEKLTGSPVDHYQTNAMIHGIETEPDARAAYEFEYDVDVTEVGFVDHPRIAMSGASPDGLVADQGMVEIKCPNTATHIDTLLGTPVADKYIKQIQWQLACTGREWCHFVSYDPRMPVSLALHVKRIERDDEMIASLEQDIATFLNEVEEKVAKLTKIKETA